MLVGVDQAGLGRLLDQLLQISLQQPQARCLELLPLRIGSEDDHPLAQRAGLLEERLARSVLLIEDSFVIGPRRLVIRVQGGHFATVLVDVRYARLSQFLKLVCQGDKLIGAGRIGDDPADLRFVFSQVGLRLLVWGQLLGRAARSDRKHERNRRRGGDSTQASLTRD